jgi:nudix motif 8
MLDYLLHLVHPPPPPPPTPTNPDSTIVQTSLRETYEELGIIEDDVDVLGILRCNWTEVATLTGISVTPVVGFIGDMNKMTLTPNPNEVESYFTLQLKNIIDEKNWTIYENSTPIFTSGQYVIYGLTAYLLEKFVKDVVVRCNIVDKE